MAESSYVAMNSERLHSWCLAVITNIDAYRQRVRDGHIDKVYDSRKRRRRWFTKKEVTREEVAKELEASSDLFSPMNCIDGWQARDVAADLLVASTISYVVNVTTSDMREMMRWTPKEKREWLQLPQSWATR